VKAMELMELNVPFDSKLGPNSELIHYYCDRGQCEPGHRWGTGVRDHYVIHYITKGTGFLRMEGRTYKLGAGQGFLLFPHTLIDYEADLEDPWHYVWVGFAGLKAGDYVGRTGMNPENPVYTYTRGTDLYECMTSIYEAEQSGITREIKQTGLLYLLLSLLIEAAPEGPAHLRREETLKEIHVRKAITYFYMNYSRQARITEAAAHVGINRKHLHAVFQEVLGISPQHFLLGYRMERAGELLCQTDMSVGDIARSVGYEDPLLFSKQFRKVKGMPPSRWRSSN